MPRGHTRQRCRGRPGRKLRHYHHHTRPARRQTACCGKHPQLGYVPTQQTVRRRAWLCCTRNYEGVGVESTWRQASSWEYLAALLWGVGVHHTTPRRHTTASKQHALRHRHGIRRDRSPPSFKKNTTMLLSSQTPARWWWRPTGTTSKERLSAGRCNTATLDYH